MNKNIVLAIASVSVIGFAILQATIAEEKPEKQAEQIKSVAWYVANIKEARKQNEECFKNAGLQSSDNCQNSLHALQISFKGGN
ncbi:MAG: EexN family lipoprotein [Methylococcales bacterium]|nr:EexN family lipoprotein [Methylococcales bacterium]